MKARAGESNMAIDQLARQDKVRHDRTRQVRTRPGMSSDTSGHAVKFSTKTNKPSQGKIQQDMAR